MNLAVVAAFTAAGLSLVNVAVSAVLARRSQLDQWRRDTELPLVAMLLTLSQDGASRWQEAAQRRTVWIQSIRDDPQRQGDPKLREDYLAFFQEAFGHFDEIRLQAAKLDLVAGGKVVEIANRVVALHESMRHLVRPASGADDFFQACLNYCTEVDHQHHRLIETTRGDLGVDRRTYRSRRHEANAR